MKNNKWNNWIVVGAISIMVAIINILHVIIGAARTPPNHIYMATGHYYFDYFLYLAAIAQGISGHWLPLNYLSNDDKLIQLRFFPYVIFGQIGRLFGLNPQLIYWIAVFLLSVIVLIVFYLIIAQVFETKPFYVKIIGFLTAIFASPFYKLVFINGQKELVAYDFWYGPSNFLRRFGVVPYHLLGLLLILIVIINIAKTYKNINNLPISKVLILGFVCALLMMVIMSFSPFSLINLLPTLAIVTLFYFIKDQKNSYKYCLFALIIMSIVVPCGVILKLSYNNIGLVKRISELEMQWQERVSLVFLLLNIGPIVFLLPFGFLNYFKKIDPLKLTLAVFTLISYGLFISPVATFLGTHNLRFFSPVNYIFFSLLTTLGLINIVNIAKTKRRLILIILTILLLGYSSYFNFINIKKRINNQDPYTPLTRITYLPKDLGEGMNYLQKQKGERAVLTAPFADIGLITPVLSYKRVYLGQKIETADYENKQSQADKFYKGLMDEKEAWKFLTKNNIGFIILTELDNYQIQSITSYNFLKRIFSNKSITIWAR